MFPKKPQLDVDRTVRSLTSLSHLLRSTQGSVAKARDYKGGGEGGAELEMKVWT